MAVDPDPDRDVREGICASLEEWDLMDWELQQHYRWLIRSSEAS